MKSRIERRSFLRLTAAGLAAGATGGLTAVPARAQAIKLTSAFLTGGTTDIFNTYLQTKRIDRKHGLEIEFTQPYVSLATYYADFVQGRYDICLGGWDFFAARFLEGVPIRLISTIVTADGVSVIAAPKGPATVAELRGKQVAAPLASSSYRQVKAALRAFHKIELEKDVQMQSMPNPATAVTFVSAHRTDAALTWEPSVSLAMTRNPDARVIYNLGQDFRAHTGHVLYTTGLAMHKRTLDAQPGLASRVAAAFRETADEMAKNLDEAVALGARRLEMEAAVLRLAFESKRLKFVVLPTSDGALRKSLQVQADFLTEHQLLTAKVAEDFFYSAR